MGGPGLGCLDRHDGAIERAQHAVQGSQATAQSRPVERGGRDDPGDGMDGPDPPGDETAGPEPARNLRAGGQTEGRVPWIVDPDPLAGPPRELPPEARTSRAVAEAPSDGAAHQRPSEIEAPLVLVLEKQAPARPQHAAELGYGHFRSGKEVEGAAAAHRHVEAF